MPCVLGLGTAAYGRAWSRVVRRTQHGSAVTARVTERYAERHIAAARPVPSVGGMTIRVLTADDHAVVRTGLATMVGTEPELELVGQATNGREAFLSLCGMRP